MVQTAVDVVDATPRHDAPAASQGRDLLADLLGRGIAAGMRARHHQLRVAFDGREWTDLRRLRARIPRCYPPSSFARRSTAATWTDPAARQAVADRLAAIDPDGWTSAEAVLEGMARIEADVEGLRQALD